MRIQHNIAALNSYRQLGSNNNSVSKNLEKLSSGYRINRAGDDAAGLAISEKMRAQITGLETASKNANDGISLVQTAEGALTEVHSMLNRMVELADQSANGTQQDAVDRENIQKEVNSLKSEIDRISESTNFNGINLLDGSLGGGKSGSIGEAVFTGAGVAKFSAASTKGMGKNSDFTTIATGTTGKDTFSVDGQTLTIDWTKGDAKTIADSLNKDFTGANALSDTQMKDMATKLTDLFNNSIKEQGLTGSVKVTHDGTNLVLESINNGSSSEFSFTGTEKPGAGTTVTSVGAAIFGNAPADGDSAKISKAGAKYNGEALTSTDNFTVNINGTKVNLALGAAIDKTKTMDEVATALETAITDATTGIAKKYNDANGLTAGTKDDTSGLTGLKATDFSVTANSDGQLVIKYTGDVENVSFNFSDVGDRSVASSLGLSSGSSAAGGGRGLNLQIGDTADSFNQLTVRVDSMSSKSLGINSVDVGTQAGAKQAVSVIKAAINKVSSTRGDLGAAQNRLEHTISNLNVTTENMTAAESRIRDVDMAKEMMNYTKNNILVQASQSMLAQANQTPQGVLQLLK